MQDRNLLTPVFVATPLEKDGAKALLLFFPEEDGVSYQSFQTNRNPHMLDSGDLDIEFV